MIETNNMTKVLGEKMILRGVNLSIEQGESAALLGANGAGKSTWLKIVAGLLKPTTGEIWINGQLRGKDNDAYRQQIGFLGHKSLLYDAFTPIENLSFSAKLYHMQAPEQRIHQLIDRVGLSFFKHDPIRTFSRGMIQRLAIARALLHEPNILLLDEPYTGLDQQSIQQFNQLLIELKGQHVTTVIVTHDFEHVQKVCDRVVVLRKGKIAADERIQGRSMEWINSLYHGELE